MKLEQLLDSLKEIGWKPYGIEKDDISVFSYDKDRKKLSIGYMNWSSPSKGDYDWLFLSLRDITTKESGLRQFCCENKMVKEDDGHITRIMNVYKDGDTIVDGGWDYHYWLMICSILDESELEDFLLDNINVECNLILNEKQEKI